MRAQGGILCLMRGSSSLKEAVQRIAPLLPTCFTRWWTTQTGWTKMLDHIKFKH